MGKPEPYLWLEESEGERALAWARAQTDRTLTDLKSDPNYQKFYDQSLALLNDPNSIESLRFIKGNLLIHFLQNDKHKRGVLRQTTLESYRTGSPRWKTLIDIDAIAKAEGIDWVYQSQGAVFFELDRDKVLLSLSKGGKDECTIREYDCKTRSFVAGGFRSNGRLQSAAWLDENSILISGNLNNTSKTKPDLYVIKRWARGQPLNKAVELFRGRKSDADVSSIILRSAEGEIDAVLAMRSLSFHDTKYYLLKTSGRRTPARCLPLPRKIDISGFIKGPVYVNGQLVFRLREDWPNQGLASGDVASFDLKKWIADGVIESKLIFRPNRRQSVQNITATRNTVVLDILDNVKSEIRVSRFADNQWATSNFRVSKKGFTGIWHASSQDNSLLLNISDFITPSSLLLCDLDSKKVEVLKKAPKSFNGSKHVVEQMEAVSKDGTRVPYYVARPKDLKFDGEAPTILCAYGGFQLCMVPEYNSIDGKLWLKKGHVSVVANVRGGGEFGPAWHQAALKDNRQKSYDDFIAVSEDLVRRGITTMKRLGIMGHSNGGLLAGAALTQKPELYNAVIIENPLLDMVRYPEISGNNLIGEFGDPKIPHERAALAKISPFKNLKKNQPYPEVLIKSSTNDDRTPPAHARKMGARLIRMGYPVLYHESPSGGHNGYTDNASLAHSYALNYTYLTRRLVGLQKPGP